LGKWSREAKRNVVGWARWHRAHAAEPHHASEVSTDGTWPAMRWDRWNRWEAGGPLWRTDVFGTTQRTVEESAVMVADWISWVRSDPAWPSRSGWGSAALCSQLSSTDSETPYCRELELPPVAAPDLARGRARWIDEIARPRWTAKIGLVRRPMLRGSKAPG